MPSNLLRQDYLDDSRYTEADGTLRRSSVFPGSAMARLTLEARY